MTAPLEVLWVTSPTCSTSDPVVRVVDAGDPQVGARVSAALRASTAERVLVHDGPTPPSEGSRRAHEEASGALLESPVDPLPGGAGITSDTVWFALRAGCGCSATPADWAMALDTPDAGLDDVAGARRCGDALASVAGIRRWSDASSVDTDRARSIGQRAVALYRSEPTSFTASGLSSFREVSAGVFNVRRVLRRLPGVGGRRSLGGAARDAAYWSGVRGVATGAEWRAFTGEVAILMYHGFGVDEPASRYVLPQRALRRQLQILRLLRRDVVDLDDYVAARLEHRLVDPRTVVLTIDDGYADTYDVAAPLLARFGMTATLFVPSARIGARNDWSSEPALAARPIAGSDRLCRPGPVTVGSHARSHPTLTELDDRHLDDEIRGSREDLEAILGRPVRTFAYPYGDEDDRTRAVVLDAGYDAAVSSRGGKNLPAERLDSLRRIEIRGTDPLWRFALAVLLGSARPVKTFRDGLRR